MSKYKDFGIVLKIPLLLGKNMNIALEKVMSKYDDDDDDNDEWPQKQS